MTEPFIPGETPRWKRKYCECGKLIDHKAKRCRHCWREIVHEDIPSKDELIRAARDLNCNFSALGKLYGVSDNAVRKWCVGYGLPRTVKALRNAIM